MIDLVSVAWNGVDEPLQHIDFDETPQFSVVLFNYSGNNANPPVAKEKVISHCISIKTEFKGVLLKELCRWAMPHAYRYIGIMDDDQHIACSAINRMLTIAEQHQFGAFHPSVSHDSFYSHAQFLQKKKTDWEHVGWIEIMSPFLRKDIFESGHEFYKRSISSYGIDRYVFPYLLRKQGLPNAVLFHSVSVKHLKPVTDGNKIFSNKMDARQEGELIRKEILSLISRDGVPFSPAELASIYELNTIRWRKLKYDFKRLLGL